MAWRWSRRRCKPRVRQNHKVFETELLRAVATSLRVDAAQRHNSEQHAGSLYLLPEDLLFIICQYLTPAEAVTLMLTCTRFWHSRRTENGIFARIWQRMTSPFDEELSRMATRFYVLRMLEYDGLLQKGSPRKYCCWGYMKAHERQAFSPEEFEKVVDLKSKQGVSYPEEATCRSCAPAKRYIWFGTCREMSFGELRHAIANPHTQQLVKDWIKFPDNSSFTFQDCSSFAGKSRRLEYMFHLARASDVGSYDSFKRHARAVNLPLCPHMKLGAGVYRLYRQPTTAYYCKFCTTMVQIVRSYVIKVYVFRYVGLLLSPTDPAWRAQSYQVRPLQLEAHCRAFCDWYGSLYGANGQVVSGSGFREFKATRAGPEWPFKGVASCKQNWVALRDTDHNSKYLLL